MVGEDVGDGSLGPRNKFLPTDVSNSTIPTRTAIIIVATMIAFAKGRRIVPSLGNKCHLEDFFFPLEELLSSSVSSCSIMQANATGSVTGLATARMLPSSASTSLVRGGMVAMVWWIGGDC